MFKSLLPWLLLGAVALHATTYVEQHGRLQVKGAQLLDQNGDTVVLRGMSMFWSQWSAKYYNGKAIDWLVSDWKINLVRAAMGVDGTTSGYMVDPAAEKAHVDTIVSAAVRNGIYVIIDWHDHNANLRTNESKAFFAEMANKYKDLPNVIWEIWNEPLDTASWLTNIKPYAEAVIPAIRKYDTDNLIIVGTRAWSQRVDDVIGHQIQDANVAYTLHFYVGSHGDWLRGIASQAIAAGIPIFVTEWGIWDQGYVLGDYTQNIDLTQVLAWTDWLEANHISSAMWSVNDKDEPSAALLSGAPAEGGWSADQLSSAGSFIRSYILGKNTGTWVPPVIPERPIDTIVLPGRLEAELYATMLGVQLEKSQDIDATSDMGYIDNGDFAEYRVNISAAGDYPLAVRYASAGLGGTLKISIDGAMAASVDLVATGDWQAWVTITDSLSLPKGLHTLRLDFEGGVTSSLFNLNYIDIGDEVTPLVSRALRSSSPVIYGKTFDLLGRQHHRVIH